MSFIKIPKQHKPFRLMRAVNDQFYFTIVAANGKTLATSETYKRKRNAIGGIEAAASVMLASDSLRNVETLDAVQDLT